MLNVSPCRDRFEWNRHVDRLGGHPLQTWGWGEVKSKHRWSAERLLVSDEEGDVVGGAQILDRSLKLPGMVMRYAPRGPFWADGHGDDVVNAIVRHAQAAKRGVVLTFEPDIETMPHADLFVPTPTPILVSRTLIVDLTQTEEEIFAGMRSGTRRDARKVARTLTFERVTDEAGVHDVLAIYRATAERAGFNLHADEYYLDIHRDLGERSYILTANDDEGPIAFVWNALSSSTAWELYGGVTERGQKARANYGLKLQAFLTCKDMGIKRYDMNGLLNDGISEFKQGFVKDGENQLAGSFDVPLSPLYSAFTKGLPLAKASVRNVAAMRRRLMHR